jgi:hypothetical protein
MNRLVVAVALTIAVYALTRRRPTITPAPRNRYRGYLDGSY